jgi:hypothetical protein
MSQSSSRGARGRITRYRFEDLLGPQDYTSGNLVDFAKASGKKYADELQEKEDVLKKQMLSDGLKSSDKDYKLNLQQLRYDYISGLAAKKLLKDIPKPDERGANEKTITIEMVDKAFKDPQNGRQALLDLVMNNSASSFNTNALRQAASSLGVKNVSNATKGKKGDDTKRAIRDLILGKSDLIRERAATEQAEAEAMEGRYTQQSLSEYSDVELKRLLSDLNLATTGTTAAMIRRILANQAPPSTTVKYSEALLKSYKVEELKDILRNIKEKVSGTKPELIKRILMSQGERGSSDESSIESMIADITKAYNEDLDLRTARRAAAEISADAYNKASVVMLKEFLRVLGLDKTIVKAGTTATKSEIIKALTGGKTTSEARSRERTRSIQTNLSLCEESTLEELIITARELGLLVNDTMDKRDICVAIHDQYLNKFSSLIISELGQAGSLENLSKLPEKERIVKIKSLARRAGYREISTMSDLLKEFLISHYRSRAAKYAPDAIDPRQDSLDTFLRTGDLPTSDSDLEDLARVFADLQPDLLSLDVDAQDQALMELYGAFISPIMSGDRGAIALLEQKFSRFAYSPARRGRQGVSTRVPQPVYQAAPASNRVSPPSSPRPSSPMIMRPSSPAYNVYPDKEDDSV